MSISNLKASSAFPLKNEGIQHICWYDKDASMKAPSTCSLSYQFPSRRWRHPLLFPIHMVGSWDDLISISNFNLRAIRHPAYWSCKWINLFERERGREGRRQGGREFRTSHVDFLPTCYIDALLLSSRGRRWIYITSGNLYSNRDSRCLQLVGKWT